MINDEFIAHVLKLYETEKLSMRQIAASCGLCRKTVSRIIHSDGEIRKPSDQDGIVAPTGASSSRGMASTRS